MKIHRTTLKILLDEIQALHDAEEELQEAAKMWISIQNDRDVGYHMQADDAYWYRSKLETKLVKYRQHLATVYDFMGDKGFVGQNGVH